MERKNIDLLEELDSLSKIHTLKRDDIDALMMEFAKRITAVLHIERVSVWLFNEKRDAIVSMGEFDLPGRKFIKGNTLLKRDYPIYFKAINENEIIIAENIYKSNFTKELSEKYSKPANIISLLDIPVRIGGELIGVMCYEKTGTKEKIFTKEEQSFALSVSLVLSSTLESRKRRALQHELDEELKQKEILIKEIHHRVKNNMSVVKGLVSLQSEKSKDDFHRNLFWECRHKINVISGIHDLMYRTKNFANVRARDYFDELLQNLALFYTIDDNIVNIDKEIDDIYLELDEALPVALMVNEVITNSFRHAFKNQKHKKISFSLKRTGKTTHLQIKDNGVGFNPETSRSDSLGMEIIKGLVDQLNGEAEFTSKDGTLFEMRYPKK